MNRPAGNNAFLTAIAADSSSQSVERLGRRRVATGQLDIRGWLALTEDGQRVGRVVETFVDRQSLLVTCVEVALDVQLASLRGARNVIVPIGCARVSSNRKHLNIRGVTKAELVHAPRVGAHRISAAEYRLLRQFFVGRAPATPLDGEPLDDILQEQQRFWGARHDGRRLDAYPCDPTRAE